MFLRNQFLNSTRIFYDAEKETGVEKTPAELRDEARKRIEVVTVKPTEQPEVEKEETEEVEENNETEVEENIEKIEEVQKTEEELETEKAEAKSAKEKERIQKRIDKEVAKRKVLETENAELKRKLASKPDDEKTLTEDDVESRAEKKAEEKAMQRQFANACNTLFKEAVKTDKDFKKKIDAIAEDVSPIPPVMIAVLEDIDNGGAVLSHLANNEDDYERIYELSPAKMAVEIAKISNKIETEKKKPKPISKVPPPLETLNGGRQTSNEVTSNDSMEEYVKKRMAQREQKRLERIR